MAPTRLYNKSLLFVFSKWTVLWTCKRATEVNSTRLILFYAATRSGVSASTDSNAVWTLSTQASSRVVRDLIWGIPNTLGCTHDTCTVPSTWSIIPSIRCTCAQIYACELAYIILTVQRDLESYYRSKKNLPKDSSWEDAQHQWWKAWSSQQSHSVELFCLLMAGY